MTVPDFQRARSSAAKQLRESAILEAARELGAERGIRQITLTEIAEAVGMHKSGCCCRYFGDPGGNLPAADRGRLAGVVMPRCGQSLRGSRRRTRSRAVADAFARTLAARGLFCDLLAARRRSTWSAVNVSLEHRSSSAFKLVTLTEVDAIVAVVRRLLPGLTERDGVDLIAAATAMAGAFWQMATPGPEAAALYRSDPRLAHAVVDVEPRVARLLTAILEGMRP